MALESLVSEQDDGSKKPYNYISALNTRRNPDILSGYATFLKGNKYFKEIQQENEEA